MSNAGLTDEGALEVVLGVSLASLCNFANNLGGAPLTPQLEPYRWSCLNSVADVSQSTRCQNIYVRSGMNMRAFNRILPCIDAPPPLVRGPIQGSKQ
jgi:hypothetical protein